MLGRSSYHTQLVIYGTNHRKCPTSVTHPHLGTIKIFICCNVCPQAGEQLCCQMLLTDHRITQISVRPQYFARGWFPQPTSGHPHQRLACMQRCSWMTTMSTTSADVVIGWTYLRTCFAAYPSTAKLLSSSRFIIAQLRCDAMATIMTRGHMQGGPQKKATISYYLNTKCSLGIKYSMRSLISVVSYCASAEK